MEEEKYKKKYENNLKALIDTIDLLSCALIFYYKKEIRACIMQYLDELYTKIVDIYYAYLDEEYSKQREIENEKKRQKIKIFEKGDMSLKNREVLKIIEIVQKYMNEEKYEELKNFLKSKKIEIALEENKASEYIDDLTNDLK